MIQSKLALVCVAGIGAAIATGCLRNVANSEAVAQVEQVFTDNRAEFVQLAESSVQELEQSGDIQLKLPDTAFYDSAWVTQGLNTDALIVDFVIDEFYLPLVYISTDNPADAYDTCANGGKPVKQLEPNWYICQRDWN